MKNFFPTIMVALTLLSISVQAQQVSDEVLPEAETALAVKLEALSPEPGPPPSPVSGQMTVRAR